MTSTPAGYTPEQRRILATVLVPAFLSLLSVSIINVTLPAIESSLHTSTSGLQWVVSGYALVFGVLLVPAGRAGDLWGRGHLFVAGLALFGLGALLSGLASNIVLLNLARVLMGMGSGVLNPQVSGILQTYFQGPLRGRAFGAFGGVIGISVAIGPVLGGMLVSLLGPDLGWRWSFLINVPIAVVGIIAARIMLPASAWRPVDRARARADFDPLGVVMLAGATVLLMVPFMELPILGWFRAGVLSGVGVLVLAGWVWWELAYRRRGRQPMVDIALFRTRSFGLGTLLISLYFLGYSSVWLLVALYFQQGLGRSALDAGLVGLPAALAGAVMAPLAGRHVHRFGRNLVVVGLLVAMLGLLLTIGVALLQPHGLSVWWMLLTMGLAGTGQGLIVSPNQTLSLSEVPLHYAGSAGGVIQTGQRIGTAMGIATISSFALGLVAGHGWGVALAGGLAAVMVMMAAALMVGLVDLRASRRAA
ncbi:MFS transporter [Aestuariimicrobium sp. p3-SID1156]|uniref:MFS transporter n=1 Tax=Aestuariimicrobium sp. p3-SID1156 TaxID=2916038 RepID=UPI00223BBD1B|nr:MFS transporter [Aestuariimicrobium sp. p3-SID1156]MCT1460348.1 MFS transporter [Aestuariimicrobium sp. p3-SID1156]